MWRNRAIGFSDARRHALRLRHLAPDAQLHSLDES
jgi:hypothetical protein